MTRLLLLLPAALVAFHHLADDGTPFTAAAHAMSGWLFVPTALLPLLVLGYRRDVPGLVAGVLVAALALAPVARGHRAAPVAEGETLRVVTANVLMVNTRTDELLAEIAAADPDVIFLEEVSHHWAAALTDPVLDAWPHRMVLPLDGSFGIAVLSRRPGAIDTIDLLGVPAARITLDNSGLRLVGVHTLPPRTDRYTETWHAQMRQLAELEADVLAGDFNATRHHPSYRRLLATGLRDAHAEAGRASARTWPNGVFRLPPLRLDHVLVGPGIDVAGVSELPPHGSDHAPVVADLVLRPS